MDMLLQPSNMTSKWNKPFFKPVETIFPCVRVGQRTVSAAHTASVVTILYWRAWEKLPVQIDDDSVNGNSSWLIVLVGVGPPLVHVRRGCALNMVSASPLAAVVTQLHW